MEGETSVCFRFNYIPTSSKYTMDGWNSASGMLTQTISLTHFFLSVKNYVLPPPIPFSSVSSLS